MLKHFAIVLLAIVLLSACAGSSKDAAPESGTLAAYIAAHPGLERASDLIACAAGGHVGFMGEGPAPVSLFFYPIEGAYDFRYWEAPSLDIDPQDDAQYAAKEKEIVPVFNGYLRRFVTDYTDRETWVMASYIADGVLHTSGRVRLKVKEKPTQYAPELVTITTRGGRPSFTWQDGRTPENVIYFEVISDPEGNLISGTYTEDRRFTFYDTSNVVINIHDVSPPPTLVSGQPYHFTLMGVSKDNWVNLFARKEFTAP